MKKEKMIFVITAALMFFLTGCRSQVPSIKIGILHSLSGTMAISESPVVDATLLAIEDINDAGGVLGYTLDPVVLDTQSDHTYSAQVAQQLVFEEQLSFIFGCWTSACRKSVLPVVEEHNALLFYPVQFEGLEDFPNIVYTGATPSQQIIPAVQWAVTEVGSRIFLVGSDYVFPRASNEIVKDYAPRIGGEVVGEEYILLGSTDVKNIVEKISSSKPDIIFNTINGDSNIAFFAALRAANITPDNIPTMSFSIAEVELQNMQVDSTGDYATWNYFQSIDNATNERFIDRFREKYGDDRVIDDPMEAAYSGVILWASAVEAAGSFEVDSVRQNLLGQGYFSPQGFIRMDEQKQYLWKRVRVGQIREDGQFYIVWESNVDIRPEPFPKSRTEAEWLSFLDNLYETWNGNWINPGN